MNAPDREAMRRPARLWLHAADDNSAAVLSVLASHLADLPAPPGCLLTGPGALGLPGAPEDGRAMQFFIQQHAPHALVLAGDRLPRAGIEAARSRRLGLFLVDADMPPDSRRWRLWPLAGRRVLAGFTQIHCRDQSVADALEPMVGADVPLLVSGAMARFPAAPPCHRAELQALGRALAGRPAWFAQSVPMAEARDVLLAHAQALRQAHRLLLIVSPEDHAQAAALAGLADDAGLVHATRSREEDITETTQIYIADTGDDVGLFQRLVQSCYLGGSLTGGTGMPHPLGAVALGAVPIFGPHVPEEHGALVARLVRSGAGRPIAAGRALGEAVCDFLLPETVARAALRGWELVTRGNDATDRVAQALVLWLRQSDPGGGIA
ncbi:MAG: hypothetical protein ACXIVG_03525 [Pararhodobacter sp.]